ncbi:hypothetical protein HYT84_00465 [Candidatus Micrarchaeota archaeon]|nr:hypothetical protein [Candidatus Micrarchaeota archaeon]
MGSNPKKVKGLGIGAETLAAIMERPETIFRGNYREVRVGVLAWEKPKLAREVEGHILVNHLSPLVRPDIGGVPVFDLELLRRFGRPGNIAAVADGTIRLFDLEAELRTPDPLYLLGLARAVQFILERTPEAVDDLARLVGVNFLLKRTRYLRFRFNLVERSELAAFERNLRQKGEPNIVEV